MSFEPVPGLSPESADSLGGEVALVLRPGQRNRIDNLLFYTQLDDAAGGGNIFEDWILRTKWNWQITIPLSIQVIVQWEDTSSNPALASIEPRRRLKGDVLLLGGGMP